MERHRGSMRGRIGCEPQHLPPGSGAAESGQSVVAHSQHHVARVQPDRCERCGPGDLHRGIGYKTAVESMT